MGIGGIDNASAATIVIPAFNEAGRLPATLEHLVAGVAAGTFGGRPVDLVVSDDGSTDATVAVVRSFAPRGVRLVSGPANRGKGAALLEGTAAATTPLVVFLDADLPVSPTTVAEMLRHVDGRPGVDLLVGSRRLPGATLDPPQPLVRRIGGNVFRSAAQVMGYRTTSDPQCGVKVLRRDGMEPVLAQLTSRGFAFDIEMIVRARRADLVVEEVPVRWRHVPGSSLRPVRDAVRTLADLARLRRHLGGSVP